ncbi:hypothetical protein ASD56_12385 [Microbacterium sp. Root166]|uniref:DUF305 domain-containing protein n=1 Tax=Microbacterium sp. Root166 TaxID=1736478 RepID=UPI0006F61FE3|nr:DUF305 domain-containing protein [Microbacterium sp. Root166]KQZ83123.1 hypothetical protein ASD56_12385 [Microbacterium sp. Root166]
MTMRSAAIVALGLAVTLAITSCAGSPDTAGDMSGMDHGSTSATANDADVMFAAMMIDHHAQAVEMSDLVLEKEDVDPRVTELAEQIKAAQQPEIELLQGWLEDWNAEPDGMAGMGHGDGMMTEGDMKALEEASGTDASRLFLEQMIEHHEGAVDMAQTEVDNGRDADAIALAEEIIEAQTAEIEAMRSLLQEG